jgi:hypothetical protein
MTLSGVSSVSSELTISPVAVSMSRIMPRSRIGRTQPPAGRVVASQWS